MPNGYSVPPGGATDTLMTALGRHGHRPAHVHFFVEAPGFRTLTTQINFGDDPFAADDFAFGTRRPAAGPQPQGDTAYRLRFRASARARQGGRELHPRPR
jgi:catechol 1,2-dioxygenase